MIKKPKIRNVIPIIIGLIIITFYLFDNYQHFKYGRKYNQQRSELQVMEIPDNWYCTYKNSNELRFSPTEKPKGLSILLDSIGYKGHIDKFIFFDEEHSEEDVFIEVKEEYTDFYRCFYDFDKNLKECTLSGDKGQITINCSVIDSLFNTQLSTIMKR